MDSNMLALLEGRLQEIEAAIQQATANFNMLEGGKQECIFWINKVKEECNKTQ